MNEYSHEAVGKELKKYNNFRRTTGMTYERLLDNHKDAVAILDSAERLLSTNVGYMTISPMLYAYLTDIALQHLAIGYALQNPVHPLEPED